MKKKALKIITEKKGEERREREGKSVDNNLSIQISNK